MSVIEAPRSTSGQEPRRRGPDTIAHGKNARAQRPTRPTLALPDDANLSMINLDVTPRGEPTRRRGTKTKLVALAAAAAALFPASVVLHTIDASRHQPPTEVLLRTDISQLVKRLPPADPHPVAQHRGPQNQ